MKTKQAIEVKAAIVGHPSVAYGDFKCFGSGSYLGRG